MTANYDEIAADAIARLLRDEHALVWPEIEARLADRPYTTPSGHHLRDGINPHHLTTGKNILVREALIEQVTATTRGEYRVGVWIPRVRHRRRTAVDRAAARKRLLHARYLSWTRVSSGRPSPIGHAAELVVQASLRAAASNPETGYRLVRPSSTGINSLFGRPVPGGPLDAAAHLVTLQSEFPIAITTAVEAKNLRHWIYPQSHELYQLLDKAARICFENQHQQMLPVLVCRRSHYTTFKMAQDLGFLVFEMRQQPIIPYQDIDPAAIEEVNAELGYDIIATREELPLIVTGFRNTIPRLAAEQAGRWARSTEHLATHFERLRDTELSSQERSEGMGFLREAFETMNGRSPQW